MSSADLSKPYSKASIFDWVYGHIYAWVHGFALRNKDRLFEASLSLIIKSATILMLILLFSLQIHDSLKGSYFSHTSSAEETAYTYTSAKNYLKYGYLNSGLLQDFSSSSDPLDHPYAYDHMPPGPDLLMSLLLKVSNNSIPFTKIFFAVLGFIGFFFYLKFIDVILQRKEQDLSYAGLGLLVTGPWIILTTLDRQVYSLFPLLMFLPFYTLDLFYKSNKLRYLILTLAVTFFSACYIEYCILTGIVFCWLLLYLTGVYPIKGRHVFIILSSFAAGIMLHLLQNLIFLGPELFFKEIYITLSNRLTGFPPQDQIRSFYENAGLVHHGSKPIVTSVLFAQIYHNFAGMGFLKYTKFFAICMLVYVYLQNAIRSKIDFDNASNEILTVLKNYLRLFIWIAGTILAPIVLFPAYAQEVNLNGVGLNKLLSGVFIAFLVGSSLDLVMRAYRQNKQGGSNVNITVNGEGNYILSMIVNWFGAARFKDKEDDIRVGDHSSPMLSKLLRGYNVIYILTSTLLVFLIGYKAIVLTMPVIKSDLSNTAQLFKEFSQKNWLDQLYDLEKYPDNLFMTNINSPTPGLLTNALGYGVCSPDSILPDGTKDLEQCKVLFAKRHSFWAQQDPKYFFYFKDMRLFPGFADCFPESNIYTDARETHSCMNKLYDRLNNNFDLLYENKIMTVFDMHSKSHKNQ